MEELVAIVAVFSTLCLGLVTFSPIGKAIAARLRGSVDAPMAEVEQLRDEVAMLRDQIAELAERQDFAERMLAQSRERGALGAGPS